METKPKPVRLAIIGAGARAVCCTDALYEKSKGEFEIVAVAEPDDARRIIFGRNYIWGPEARKERQTLHGAEDSQPDEPGPKDGESFTGWEEWAAHYEEMQKANSATEDCISKRKGRGQNRVDAVLIFLMDELHLPAIRRIWPLNVHVFCEKPLATNLDDVLEVRRITQIESPRDKIFGIGHVLRYSPFNLLLRRLAVEEAHIGEIMSMEHTEPVGHWHFAHSFVRGNWRRQDTSAPSLLTKACHDIDFILWIMSTPARGKANNDRLSEMAYPKHVPSRISSLGGLNYFREELKPERAGHATNCVECLHEPSCAYSAPRLYIKNGIEAGNVKWPAGAVVPDIEDIVRDRGLREGRARLMAALSQDYTVDTPDDVIRSRNWYGRCVWESDNDVCDDQTVTIIWADSGEACSSASSSQEGSPDSGIETRKRPRPNGRPQHRKKLATFHMIAATERMCERRGRIYGSRGEIVYDSHRISVHNFQTGDTAVYSAPTGGTHGGADVGMMSHFVQATRAAEGMNPGSPAMSSREAQAEYLGCSIDDIILSHAVVFAAEQARTSEEIVDWPRWWLKKTGEKVGEGTSG